MQRVRAHKTGAKIFNRAHEHTAHDSSKNTHITADTHVLTSHARAFAHTHTRTRTRTRIRTHSAGQRLSAHV